MSWQRVETLPWMEPIDFAAQFTGQNMALLYSSLSEHYTGKVSYLLVEPLETREGSDWFEVPRIRGGDEALPYWVGYIGYGMRESEERSGQSPIPLPDFRLVRYRKLYRFDQQQQILESFIEQGKPETSLRHSAPASTPAVVKNIRSNFSKDTYKEVVAKTIEKIRSGAFYQANITRKFFGEFDVTPNGIELFRALSAASPAPYSAYIRHGSQSILSSSPECFLTIDVNGAITTRPIKGSARRGTGEMEDLIIKRELLSSAKNHAENLMIVDLMRNDLARVSVPRTVEVVEQAGLYSYTTIHHLISTVRAQRRPEVSAVDVVRACFPPGSMTGAPKLAAIDWCNTQEHIERGVYSGAIGWFGSGNSCDLSVVIRTLILDSNKFEFQVGGGIVADSTPEDEWEETLVKARGILRAIGVSEEDIAAI